MLRTIASVLLWVPELEPAIAWYRAVLGAEPEVVLAERLVVFQIGSDLRLTLARSEGGPRPGSAGLVCGDLAAALSLWRNWVGVVETECLGPHWPFQFVILRDPGDNCLVVVEAIPGCEPVGQNGEAKTGV